MPWGQDRPTLDVLAGDPGVLLTARQQRKLGASALAVWRRLLDDRGYAARAMTVNVAGLARDVSLPRRTVEWALSRLQAAGLVSRKLTRQRRRDGWAANLLVTVLGGSQVAGGVEELWAPIMTARWCDDQPGHGGSRLRASTFAGAKGGPRIKHLQSKIAGQLDIDSNTYTPSAFPNGKTGAAPEAAPRLHMIDTKSVPRHRLSHPKLPAGDPDDPQTGLRTQRVWVKHMVDAYLAAHKAHGLRPFFGLPKAKTEPVLATWDPANGTTAGTLGDTPGRCDDGLEKWKHWKPLLKCARALHERDIPPQTWAEWMISRTPGKVMPIRRVFSGDMVNENAVRHAFRNESGYGHGGQGLGAAPATVHLEQMYRCRERDRRARGVTYLLGLPTWYVLKRQLEIAEGAEDPMERFPQAPQLEEP